MMAQSRSGRNCPETPAMMRSPVLSSMPTCSKLMWKEDEDEMDAEVLALSYSLLLVLSAVWEEEKEVGFSR